jgi:hypothetical protein
MCFEVSAIQSAVQPLGTVQLNKGAGTVVAVRMCDALPEDDKLTNHMLRDSGQTRAASLCLVDQAMTCRASAVADSGCRQAGLGSNV